MPHFDKWLSFSLFVLMSKEYCVRYLICKRQGHSGKNDGWKFSRKFMNVFKTSATEKKLKISMKFLLMSYCSQFKIQRKVGSVLNFGDLICF